MVTVLIYLLLFFFLVLSTLNAFKNKSLSVCTILLWGGLLCISLFHISGSTVDADGILHEQFGFLPIGFGLMIMGMLGELLRISLNLYQDKLR